MNSFTPHPRPGSFPPQDRPPLGLAVLRSCQRAAILAVGGLCITSSASAWSDLYVNSITGSDQLGTGAVGAPFQTITHTLTVAQAGDDIVLQNGPYGPSTGESMPMLVRSGVTIRGENPAGATLKFPDPLAPIKSVFEVQLDGALVLRDLEIETTDLAVRLVTDAELPFSGLLMVNVQIRSGTSESAFGGVFLEGDRFGGSSTVNVVSSKLDCDFAIRMEARGGSAHELRIENTQLRGGLTAVEMSASGAGSSHQALLFNCIVHQSFTGLAILPQDQATVDLDVYNSTFFQNGAPGLPSIFSGSITQPFALGASTVVVQNSVFWEDQANRNIPHFNPQTYTLDHNIFGQANLVSGTNLAANPSLPMFVDAPGGDWHLALNSPAIDAGLGSGTSIDFDGDPRNDCASGPADIGADEYILDYLYFTERPKIGTTATLRVIGTPGETFEALYYLPPAPFPFCFPPVPTSTSVVPGGPWTIGADGVGEAPIPIPLNPNLVGQSLAWSAVLIAPTFLHGTKNVHVATFED